MGETLGFECKRCGNCCSSGWELHVDLWIIEKWMRERRRDLLYHVVFRPRFLLHPEYSNYEPRFIIDNGNLLFGDHGKKPCPFLIGSPGAKTSCRIYEDRPLVCREFPLKKGADGEYRVKTDVLHVCRGARVYFERRARLAGKSLNEYMHSIPKVESPRESYAMTPELAEILSQHYRSMSEEERATGLMFPELRDEDYAERVFKRLAKMYKPLNLRVRVTSDQGLAILEAYGRDDIGGMVEIINGITARAKDLLEKLLNE
ncbi:MAG: YkgJ family cysteine cluster protein [Candidatus Geothermarchaeales archaeon]